MRIPGVRSPVWGTAVLLVLAAGALASEARGQHPDRTARRNALYLEFGGNGLGLSANYDRRFSERLGARVGYGSLLNGKTIPVMAYYLVGRGTHALELGGGPIVAFRRSSSGVYFGGDYESDRRLFRAGADAGLAGTAMIGYRRQPVRGGFVFRAGFTPYFGGGKIFPWGGFSLGWAF